MPFHLSDPAKAYTALIREKYRHAQDHLVDRLGESNWQRHKSVRDRMENATQAVKNDARLAVDVDPSAKNTDALYSAFRPYSTFQDSGLGISVPSKIEYALSHSSFQSSNIESEQGSIRVPPTPKEVGTGIPFQCPFCSSTLANIRSRVEWKLVSPSIFI